jgi:Xaa-Pro aminopeptidase
MTAAPTDVSSWLGLPARPDPARMGRERGARLRGVMANKGIDALVLLSNSNVTYATGASWPLSDAGRGNVERPVAVVLADDDMPHLFTPFVADVATQLDLDEDHLHGPTYLDVDEGVAAFAEALADLVPATATMAIDDVTGAMHAARETFFGEWPPRSASDVMGPARLVPGARQTDLTATFLHRAFELGAEANVLDPIWQVMPDRQADLPWTTHGDLACPLLSTERELERGDVCWVDTGISFSGFHSDFGRTWVVGDEPTDRQKAQYQGWRHINDAVVSVLRAGVSAADLTAAARQASGVDRPWMSHFYLGHGLGLDSAEAPYVGTDLGDGYDLRLVLEAGTVVVIEPVVWDEGHSGYRSENVFVVTDDGCVNLTDYPYHPYGD